MEDPVGPSGEVTIFLDAETVIALSEQAVGAGVRDRGMIEGAVARPALGFAGIWAHPTFMGKVAALLHGLARTQGFHDGNKRTAWLAANAMLIANGFSARRVGDAQAEAVILGVAVGVVSVELLAEWLTEICFPLGSTTSVPGRRTINGGNMQLVKLADANATIANIDFRDVVVEGPAVVVMAGCELDSCSFDNGGGSFESIAWEVDPPCAAGHRRRSTP